MGARITFVREARSLLARGAMTSTLRSLAAAPILLLAAACAAGGAEPSAQVASASTRSAPIPDNLIPVPLVRQKTDYSCGDASALAVLRYWDYADYGSTPESDLYGPLGTTATDGTDPTPIRDYLQTVSGLHADYQHGADAVSEDDLVAAIDRGDPPIVDIEAWQGTKKDWTTDWDDGHYVVLVGYDAERFFFMDPSTGGHYAFIPRAEFDDRWHDVVGKSTHAFHMVIFVHGDGTPHADERPPHPTATRID
jgi:predicted double-glycine peptidase